MFYTKKIKKHIISSSGNYSAIISLMVPKEQYSSIDLSKLDETKYSQIITVFKEEKINSSTDVENALNSFLKEEVNFFQITFNHKKLSDLAKVYEWKSPENKILDYKYLGYDDLRKNYIYYKNTSIDFIKEKLRENLKDVIKK